MVISFLKRLFKSNQDSVRALNIVLQDIQILPMDDKTSVTKEMREIIYEVFARYKLLEKFKGYKKYFIYVSDQVSPKNTVREAHKIWLDLSRLDIFDGLSQRNEDTLCTDKFLLVRLECINNQTLNMGSWYGFNGYFLSLLINPKTLSIWDMRGTVTT